MKKIFEANINNEVVIFFQTFFQNNLSYEITNKKLYDLFGILSFFENENELQLLNKNIFINDNKNENLDRTEYGDFQTNENLSNQITLNFADKIYPEIIIEPTCGKGNFIIASLRNFKTINTIFAIEIYKPYIWETKFNIINFYLNNPKNKKPDIKIIHDDVFNFNFKKIVELFPTKEVLIIGNPPWITNSKLSTINSNNLPKKRNFKNHNGLDAITGKGNFDIAEFITLLMIETFQNLKGNLLLLIKNSVIKNIIFDQNKRNFSIADNTKYCINSKKEFNVSVEASLFTCKLNSKPEYNCKEYNFYDFTFNKPKENKEKLKFGWLNNKFISNFDTYLNTKEIEGKFPFIWRQGLKHDCSNIMELEKINGHYINKLNEKIRLEDDLVYGLLKSSDLKNTVIDKTRKFTIVTQKKVGQETNFIKEYPQTYNYLIKNQESFNARKSSIYKNKPQFSIFGIGDYSFKPYKVAISGLYKTFHFTLILPQNKKAVMLDDTCYLIGFDKIEFAVYSLILLNSQTTKQFLESITFSDAKRTFTKDVLMRINLFELTNKIELNYIEIELSKINKLYELNLNLNLWLDFIKEIKITNTNQMELFNYI